MLKLYNTLSRKKQVFQPLRDKKVGLYICGPTVYDFAHLGNLRTYIFEDILRRTLEHNGYQVKQVMNITDVEDKIIKRAKKENKNIYKITKPFTKIFFADIKKLNIKKAEIYPKATNHIREMIGLIQLLIKKGVAYQGKDKSIYFNVGKFGNYGRLSELKKREIKIGARIAADEYNKKEARDFVLWKTKKHEWPRIKTRMATNKFVVIDSEPAWQSPWGWGRPGWHIECSAMAMKYLGNTLDIHAGAVDLIFPHHENEIAQSEAATGKKFVNYWIHGEHLLVDNQRMAKSLGNFYTLRNLENKKFNPLAFRYLVLTSHYRSKLNFTWKSLAAGQNALDNLYNEFRNSILRTSDVQNIDINFRTSDVKKLKYRKSFMTAVNDDLNTPKALTIVWQVIKDKRISPTDKKQLLLEFNQVLGLNLDKIKSLKIPQKIKQLATKREKLRVNKQFIQADRLRKKIEALGYIIEDTASGPRVSQIHLE